MTAAQSGDVRYPSSQAGAQFCQLGDFVSKSGNFPDPLATSTASKAPSSNSSNFFWFVGE